jgi:hypothetical protein
MEQRLRSAELTLEGISQLLDAVNHMTMQVQQELSDVGDDTEGRGAGMLEATCLLTESSITLIDMVKVLALNAESRLLEAVNHEPRREQCGEDAAACALECQSQAAALRRVIQGCEEFKTTASSNLAWAKQLAASKASPQAIFKALIARVSQ